MRCFTLFVFSAGVAFAATSVSAGDATPVAPKNPKDDDKEETLVLSPFEVTPSAGTGYSASSTLAGARLRTSLADVGGSVSVVTSKFLGATVGGFKDINFGRNLLEWGLLPRADEMSIEGLFSEFDLPTPEADCGGRLMVVTGDAKAAAILNKPEVTHLAQIGFSSGFDAQAWRRDPLLLVVVADVSGSMSGNLPLLQDAIRTMLGKLGPDDAFALVSFDSYVKLEYAPARLSAAEASAMKAAIDGLRIRGGTNIEAGLELGFRVAGTKVDDVARRSRVVLITDAMPNVGATSPDSFMARAEAASLAGTGLTTIGLGLEFSADFVKQVSSVGGGNAFYFADAAQMQRKFDADFDFMVSELAYDLAIRVDPAPGCRLLDVYGLPGDVYARTPEGGLLLDVPTLFLSRERGGIFLSFAAPAGAGEGVVLGRASLSYVTHGATEPESSEFDLVTRSEANAGVGIVRGELLINEYEALRVAATAFYEEGDLAAAHAQAQALVGLFEGESDAALLKETALLQNAARFLARAVESPKLERRVLRRSAEESPLAGVWRFDDAEAPARYLVLSPTGQAALLDDPADGRLQVLGWDGRRFESNGDAAGALAVKRGQLEYRADRNSTWTLVRCEPAAVWAETAAVDTVIPWFCGVAVDDDESYRAADTLVGTRLQVDGRDLADAVTVVTAQVLEATGTPD